jgi:hypothetical protein
MFSPFTVATTLEVVCAAARETAARSPAISSSALWILMPDIALGGFFFVKVVEPAPRMGIEN